MDVMRLTGRQAGRWRRGLTGRAPAKQKASVRLECASNIGTLCRRRRRSTQVPNTVSINAMSLYALMDGNFLPSLFALGRPRSFC